MNRLMSGTKFCPQNNCLVLIVGPTAVGKTSVSIKLAKEFGTEIISADSRQIYKGISIGTASPGPAELSSVTHHMIGTLDLTEKYNVYRFEKDVLAISERLFLNHNIVFLVGGSGLYINAVCHGIDEMPDTDDELRNELNTIFKTSGIVPLRRQLMLLDPLSYENIDISNHKRIIRALEVCITTGKPYSSFLSKKTVLRPFRIIKIGLRRDRKELYDIINKRVDVMIMEGLEDEARRFYHLRHLNSFQTVGYRELFDYFDGKTTLPEAIEKIKTNTRRYAKKQMTWFERDKDIAWFHPSETEKITLFIKKQQKHAL